MFIKDAKISLIDYPGHIACTIFTGGCNLRCGYCYNEDLVLRPQEIPSFPNIFDFLEKRRQIIDGVCLTGGEPLIHSDIELFLKKIKKMGLRIKIDTNGTYPDRLQNLLKIIDYVAMDIKAPLEKYKSITRTDVDIGRIKKSISLIKNSHVQHEFRTTAAPGLKEEDIIQIAVMLNSNNYYLQKFQHQPTLIDKTLKNSSIGYKEALSIKKYCLDSHGLYIHLRSF